MDTDPTSRRAKATQKADGAKEVEAKASTLLRMSGAGMEKKEYLYVVCSKTNS